MNVQDYKNHSHLWFRLCYSAAVNPKVQSQYAVPYEDPNDLEDLVKVMHPDPNFMAAALAGGIVPPIEAYLADQKTTEAYEKEHGSQKGFDWRNHEPQHPYAEPRGPMTEEEAIEYLIMKDVPTSVWRDYRGNRTIMKIVKRDTVPSNRVYRNAWRLNQELENAV